MNQAKIGKFIAERRKVINLTQFQLAEKLGVTDRAVQNGKRVERCPTRQLCLNFVRF